MEDILTPAAEALVKTLLEFRQQAEDAAGTFTELRQKVEGHEQGLENDWNALTASVQSLLAAVTERDAELGPKAETASGAVEQLGGLLPQVQEVLEAALGENVEQLEALAAQAQRAEDEAERVVGESTESTAGKIGGQLGYVAEGAATTAEEAVRSIREGFVAQAEASVTAAEDLIETTSKILTDSATWMKQTVVVWTSQMTQVEDQVALESFRAAGPAAKVAVEQAIGTYAAAQQAALEQVERLVGEARQQLADLEEAVQESDGQLKDASEQATSETGAFLIAMSEATEALGRVEQLMREYKAL
jgi:hypothetical protein